MVSSFFVMSLGFESLCKLLPRQKFTVSFETFNKIWLNKSTNYLISCSSLECLF